jgi:hypothetical protein
MDKLIITILAISISITAAILGAYHVGYDTGKSHELWLVTHFQECMKDPHKSHEDLYKFCSWQYLPEQK